MTQRLFTETIVQAFNQKEFNLKGDQLIEETLGQDVPRDIHIDNVQPVYERIRDILHNALNQVRSNTISLADLRRLRISFYEAKDQFFLLEEKELTDVQEMERNTKWHERSKLVRVFVNSEMGDQLDEERKEAKLASSIAKNFANHLKDLEEAIDQHILVVGEGRIPAFGQQVRTWRKIGQLRRNAVSAKEKIIFAYNRIGNASCGSCGSSIAWATQGTRDSLSSADYNLNDQLKVLSPWHDMLTKEVEQAVDDVRSKLMIQL